MPKFKYSKKIKEFGFVEFEEESSVQKALKTFQAVGGVLTYEDTDPGKLVSITSFGKEKEEEQDSKAKGVAAEKDAGDKDVKVADKSGKDEDEEEPPPAKRIRTDNGDSSEAEGDRDSANGGSASENEVEEATEVDGGAKPEVGEVKKKKRHRKGTSGVKKEIQQDDKVYELKVMPK